MILVHGRLLFIQALSFLSQSLIYWTFHMLTQLFISLIYSFTYSLYAFRAFNQGSCYSANHIRIFGEPKFSVTYLTGYQ
jgi:hypothetical protein